ncbi:MFS transporter [Streptomyces griseofuscus]|uniref:hypothetical protein n=1 Tax=Streptomyces griseofuscus TaxID=146922 RepID=UPI0036B67DA6
MIDRLGHSPAYAGVPYAVQGAGSVTVGLLTGPGPRLLGARRFAAAGTALTGLAVIARAAASDPVALASPSASGLGLPCVLTTALTAVQREPPDALLGRVRPPRAHRTSSAPRRACWPPGGSRRRAQP